MKFLRLNLYQPTANYRPHYSMGTVRHSYPLPPPSSVLGLIHRALGCKPGKTYKDKGKTIKRIDLAILGKYEGLGWDYQWLLSPKEGGDILFTSSLSPLKDIKFKQVPGKIQLLVDVKLLIYISLNEEAVRQIKEMNGSIINVEDALEYIKNKFEEPPETLYLGRAEDLIILKKAEIKELSPPDGFSPDLKEYSQWIPVEEARKYEIEGVIFNLPGYYEKKKIKVKMKKEKEWVIRDFNFHPCVYAEHQEITPFGFEKEENFSNLLIDKEKDLPVWFLNLNKEE